MRKILLIVKREYISRVRNRTFILTTLLTPLFFVLVMGGATLLSTQRQSKQGIGRTDPLHSPSQITKLKTKQRSIDEANGNSEDLAYGIGYGSGILIYLTMLTYGMMVLHGVREEKTNRIAEVIVSSVRPFQLMMGKIIGIGAVGITQFLLWTILLFVGLMTGQSFISHETIEQVNLVPYNSSILPLVIVCFIFYFIGGYLFYAALFAAAGSVIDETHGSQGITLPITMPLFFSFFIMTTAVQAPDSSLAVWASIIPFSSSSVMMARIAYGVPGTVPYWQLALSMASLIIGFLFTTWMAGKIYRTGLLMYGKKITWKEMIRWAFY